MKAIIVAAGRGSRLFPYTKNVPKPLVSLNGRSIIEYSLDSFSSEGIRQVVIVVGYRAKQFGKVLGKKYKNCNITYVMNKDFGHTQNMDSLYLARKYLSGGFIFLNADVIFQKKLLTRLIRSRKGDVCVVDRKCQLTESVMKVRIVKNKIVAINRILKDANGRAVGIYKFSRKGARKYFEEMRALKKGGRKNFQIEAALSNFIKGNKLSVLDTHNLLWQEIDDESDFRNAEEIVARL